MQKFQALVTAIATISLAACADSNPPTSVVFGKDRPEPSLALASGDNKVVVTEEDIARQPENTPPTRNWVLYTRLAGNGAFRTGPIGEQ